MRRIFKHPQSEIVSQNLRYLQNGSNKRLNEILYREQYGFCAYTEEYISRTDAKDIEHFNPHLKNTEEDNYHNWFLVKHQWNLEKAEKWEAFQPILNPCSEDLEERVIYSDGDYVSGSTDDKESENLIQLTKISDPILAKNRKQYIRRKKDEMVAFSQNANDFFEVLLSDDLNQIKYPRAIKEEFGVDIIQFLSNS